MSTPFRSMDEAVAAVRPTDELGLGLGPAHPGSFLHALGARTDWQDLTIYGALLTDLYEVFTRPGVHHQSGFFGPAERFLIDSGADVQFVPADFRRFAPVLERVAPRVLATSASMPDADGWCSMSLHAGASFEELVRGCADPERVVVVEAHPGLPHTFGLEPEFPHRLHVDQIDVLVQGDRPVFVLEDPPPSDVEVAIARHVRGYISDGCTLQTGIGGIPSTVMSVLAGEEGGGGYGIHSEMFTTGLMKLQRSGKVDNAHKGIHEGYSVTTFAAGTLELYEWLDGNSEVRFLPVSVVNSPEVIAANHAMVTINGAIAVDLYGQVVADTIDGRQYSGIGGHEDFIAASGLELEDRSLVCLPSTANVKGELRSRIVQHLPTGSVVTTPRHQLDVVVTEHGTAELRGRTVRERAMAMASVADPEFREALMAVAAEFH